MTTLHIVRQSAFSSNDLAQCISVLEPQDTIVLIDDGCYNLNHELMSHLINKLDSAMQITVIGEHAKARAITPSNTIKSIEMTNVVELTFLHQKVITWQ